jgi:hypothetical protein
MSGALVPPVLDVVSGAGAGAGAVPGEGVASSLPESGAGAGSGAGRGGVGAGSGAGAPPEPGAEIPPDWARAGGAAKAVTSSASATTRAPRERAERLNPMRVTGRI